VNRGRGAGTRAQYLFASLAFVTALTHTAAQLPTLSAVRGLAHRVALAHTYDAILNADFDEVADRLAPVCATTPEWCSVMEAVSWWWQIALDEDDDRHDAAFSRSVDEAITRAERWSEREPLRAEAWFAVGAAYGARAQWRVARDSRLAAARDGKHIKSALERALTLDPTMHDAKFGIGMYRYYADVAPAAFRMLRWLLLLPGGDRDAGLQQMLEAREQGTVVAGEADYQLHLSYLWYEGRHHDALALIRRLQQRYPRNPLFPLSEARIHSVYFDDHRTSAIVLRAVIARAQNGEINAPALALRRATTALRALDVR
jgi:hypothetical protein